MACLRPITEPTVQAEVLTLARKGIELGTGKARGDSAIPEALIPWLHLAPGKAEHCSGRFAEAFATSAASFFRVTQSTVSANSFHLTFPTVLGRSYQVQSSVNLANPWTNIGTPAAGTGSALTLPVNVSGETQHFFRVSVQ
ncbi:MAG: hypothetical protein JNJ83_18300 [Verrucomicrobiaceae bacterium]|nr:hypothetical protein [Verrucomicrobiaceae bacterium]